MKDVYALSLSIFASVLLAFVFTSRLFAIGGINPDLPLLFFVWLMILPAKKRMNPVSFFFTLAIFSGSVFFLGGFWMIEIILFAAVIALAFFGSRFLSGNWFLDFLAVQIVAAFAFYGISALVVKSPFLFSAVSYEVLYGIALSLIFWPIGRKMIA